MVAFFCGWVGGMAILKLPLWWVYRSGVNSKIRASNSTSFLVPSIGGRYHIITQLAIYKWYILPIGGLYGTYHLLREPNNHWMVDSSQPNKSPFEMKTWGGHWWRNLWGWEFHHYIIGLGAIFRSSCINLDVFVVQGDFFGKICHHLKQWPSFSYDSTICDISNDAHLNGRRMFSTSTSPRLGYFSGADLFRGIRIQGNVYITTKQSQHFGETFFYFYQKSWTLPWKLTYSPLKIECRLEDSFHFEMVPFQGLLVC